MCACCLSHLLLLYIGRVHGAISGCTVLLEVHPASAQNKNLISDTAKGHDTSTNSTQLLSRVGTSLCNSMCHSLKTQYFASFNFSREQLCCFLPGCVSMKSKEWVLFETQMNEMNGMILIPNVH